MYYDQRGGGRSNLAAGAAPVGWQGHVDDVESVREHLGEQRLDLLGFSWGALLALLFALEHPGRVGRLVLVSAPPTVAGHEESMQANLRCAAARPELLALLARLAPVASAPDDPGCERARFAGKVAPYFADPRRALDLEPVRTDEGAAAAVTRSLQLFDLGARLAGLRALPILVVHGAEDVLPPAVAAETAGRLGARLVVLEGAGHVPFVEAEPAFLAAVLTFLDEPA